MHGETRDFSSPPRAIGAIDLPSPYAPSDPAFLDDVARLLRNSPAVGRPEVSPSSRWAKLVVELESHPVHECQRRDEHLAALKSRLSLERQIEQSERQLAKRSGSVVRRFELVYDLLGGLDCVEDWTLTGRGDRLARIYHECDLLVTLALDDGVFDGLDVAGTAAMVAAIVYEERRPDGVRRSAPTPALQQRFARLERLWERITRAERERGLPQMRKPDAGFMTLIHGWANGIELGPLLEGAMSGGDFVRTTKMVIDVLSQLAELAPDLGTRATAARAVTAVRRGVVADFGPSAAPPLADTPGPERTR